MLYLPWHTSSAVRVHIHEVGSRVHLHSTARKVVIVFKIAFTNQYWIHENEPTHRYSSSRGLFLCRCQVTRSCTRTEQQGAVPAQELGEAAEAGSEHWPVPDLSQVVPAHGSKMLRATGLTYSKEWRGLLCPLVPLCKSVVVEVTTWHLISAMHFETILREIHGDHVNQGCQT